MIHHEPALAGQGHRCVSAAHSSESDGGGRGGPPQTQGATRVGCWVSQIIEGHGSIPGGAAQRHRVRVSTRRLLGRRLGRGAGCSNGSIVFFGDGEATTTGGGGGQQPQPGTGAGSTKAAGYWGRNLMMGGEKNRFNAAAMIVLALYPPRLVGRGGDETPQIAAFGPDRSQNPLSLLPSAGRRLGGSFPFLPSSRFARWWCSSRRAAATEPVFWRVRWWDPTTRQQPAAAMA